MLGDDLGIGNHLEVYISVGLEKVFNLRISLSDESGALVLRVDIPIYITIRITPRIHAERNSITGSEGC